MTEHEKRTPNMQFCASGAKANRHQLEFSPWLRLSTISKTTGRKLFYKLAAEASSWNYDSPLAQCLYVTCKPKTMIPNKASLTKISQLETLVNIDKADHEFKDIAKLFVSAAKDWDTFNQDDISDFVKELKEYFSAPLTKENITNKPLDTSGNNAWRHEAGSSIIEMLNFSERTCNQTNFDNILSDILCHYEQQMQNIDFIADLKYLTAEEGGRKTPVCSGYRSQVKFDFDEMQTSGQQTFLNKDIVYPGDTVEVSIRIVSVEHFSRTLTEGMPFEFREGSNIIGTGLITSILNDSLKKASR